MFKFTPNLNFTWPVKVIEPDQLNPGKFIEHEFEALFEMLPPDESKKSAKERLAIAAKITPELTDAEVDAIQTELDNHDLKSVKRVLRGWNGVNDADDKPIPFNDTTFRMLYEYRHIRNGFVRAYMDALSEDKARVGN
ncbi:hypothetical protein [Brucella pituitosa]|uniref:hypothetical protein n=1 Tax=Brucella pituitosa TaxID=571256 RepID=UPI003F4AAABC